jgi:GTP pyrophosphokinase
MAHSESIDLGLKLLTQALRAEGIEKMPDDPSRYQGLWEKVLRFTGNRNRSDLLVDVGLGKRIASIVAKRMAALLSEMGEKPDPLLMTRERFMANDTISQGAILLDGTENASVVYSHCCRPLPGDKIIGYLGRGEGLAVHTADCSVGLKLQ